MAEDKRKEMTWNLYNREYLITEDSITIPLNKLDFIGEYPDLHINTLHYDFFAIMLKVVREQLKNDSICDEARPYIESMEQVLNEMFVKVAPGTQYDPIRRAL